jgi:hypothetical protein
VKVAAAMTNGIWDRLRYAAEGAVQAYVFVARPGLVLVVGGVIACMLLLACWEDIVCAKRALARLAREYCLALTTAVLLLLLLDALANAFRGPEPLRLLTSGRLVLMTALLSGAAFVSRILLFRLGELDEHDVKVSWGSVAVKAAALILLCISAAGLIARHYAYTVIPLLLLTPAFTWAAAKHSGSSRVTDLVGRVRTPSADRNRLWAMVMVILLVGWVGLMALGTKLPQVVFARVALFTLWTALVALFALTTLITAAVISPANWVSASLTGTVTTMSAFTFAAVPIAAIGHLDAIVKPLQFMLVVVMLILLYATVGVRVKLPGSLRQAEYVLTAFAGELGPRTKGMLPGRPDDKDHDTNVGLAELIACAVRDRGRPPDEPSLRRDVIWACAHEFLRQEGAPDITFDQAKERCKWVVGNLMPKWISLRGRDYALTDFGKNVLYETRNATYTTQEIIGKLRP